MLEFMFSVFGVWGGGGGGDFVRPRDHGQELLKRYWQFVSHICSKNKNKTLCSKTMFINFE